jgi:hypothetical protein
MERHGYRNVVAERLREGYEARVQARLDRARQPAGEPTSQPATLEEIRRQARESWLRLRQESRDTPADGGKGRTPDDDFAR